MGLSTKLVIVKSPVPHVTVMLAVRVRAQAYELPAVYDSLYVVSPLALVV